VALLDFTAGQRQQLAKCGVLPEQVEQLRHALVAIKCALQPPPGRNATAKILADVTKHAEALAALLANMWNQTDAAHGQAMIEVEQRYWEERPDDIGPSSAYFVIPQLAALADAARAALEAMPKDQARHRTGSGEPIKRIKDALLRGWIDAQGPRDVRIIDGREYKAALPPFPDKFHARESKQFREIVAVCYDAAGAPRDYEPLAAIRACARDEKQQRKELLAVVKEAIRPVMPDRRVRPIAKRGDRQ
jgi:hypothetical protein